MSDEPRFQLRVFALKWALMLSLMLSLAVLGTAVGWSKLLKAL